MMPTSIPDRLIVLTFDDSVSNHATHVAPLLKKFGFGATFFITEFVGTGDDLFEKDKKQYMTWEQIESIDRLGFEIGNHTGHHATITDLGREALLEEIEFIERRCAEHRIARPVTFCYPGGSTSPLAFPILKQKDYIAARCCWDRVYDPAKDEPFLIPSFVIHGGDEKFFFNAVEQAREGRITVLTFHGVPEYNHPWVDTTPERFLKYMTHLAENGCKVIAMRDLAPYLGR